MTEVKRKRGRPKRPVPPDEIASQMAVVRFYETRLAEAEEKLGALVAAKNDREAAVAPYLHKKSSPPGGAGS